jgi:4-hydroxy-tetrahydrodipicolinate reductase
MQDGAVRVAVVGAGGRMGREVLKALTPQEGFEIVLAVDKDYGGTDARELVGPKGPAIVLEEKLGAALDRVPVDVLVDFSHASAAATQALSAVKRKVSPVIGTTGISDLDLKEIAEQCADHETPGLYAPNFAIGAVLMMRFAQTAAKWLPDAEIIEMHHDRKEDAPSGTAVLTAHLIAEARKEPPTRLPRPQFKVEGVRGGVWKDVHIHSVRLPGLVAHQEVLFGSPGETLSIRHDSLDRSCFMSGVKLAVRRVRSLSGLVVGLDRLLFE